MVEIIQDFARKAVQVDDAWFWYEWREAYLEAQAVGDEEKLAELDKAKEEQEVTEAWVALLGWLKPGVLKEA